MDFDLSETQALVHDALAGTFSHFQTVPAGAFGEYLLAPELDRLLADGGFFSMATTEGHGPLDAALLVYEAARLPFLVEVAATALIAPLLGEPDLPRPIAIADDRTGAIRNLPGARTLLLLEGGEAYVASLEDQSIEPLASVLGYPFGTLKNPSALITRSLGPGSGAQLEKWWQVALAAEASGLMRAAFDTTLAYVRERKQFGRAIGSFQAVQHRLATDIQLASGCQWLALRAAESGLASDAAVAALYAQEQMRTIVNDMHQFSGAIGLTLEYPLHFWTYRLKALQGELGGITRQAEAACRVFDRD